MIHTVYDITGCGSNDIPADQILTAMRQTAELLGATIRAELAEPFQPHGATCVLILAESHITVSTWPEDGLAHIDVFTCRADLHPDHAVTPILNLLSGQITRQQQIPRLAPQPDDHLVPQPDG